MINLNKNICLVLNSSWQPICVKSVKQAVSDLFSGNFKAINIKYDPEGNVTEMIPMDWEQWAELDISKEDYYITSPNLRVKIPTILVATNFNKIIYKSPKLSAENIRKRDNNICQYTGKKLSFKDGSIDHIIPKSRGGKDTWENLVLCDKKLNTIKGSKTPDEAGLELLSEPRKPQKSSFSDELTNLQHKDWSHFVI